jgi:L,D-transpeptidase YcbB
VRQNEKCLIIPSLAQLGDVVADLLSWIGWVLSILSDTKATRKIAQKIPVFRGMLCFNRGGRTFLIRKGQSAPHSSAFGASLRARAKNGGFAMPGLRFDRLFALTWLILLLLSPRVALAGAIADADKPLPNVETGGAPTEADSKRTTEKPAGSDAETPVPLRGGVPAASERAGEWTGRDTKLESSDQTGALMPAPLPAAVPTGKTDQLVTGPAAAGILTPTPPSAIPNADQPVEEPSPAVHATPAAAATPNSEQPVVESAPAVVPTPAAAASPNADQPVGKPSPAVVTTPVSAPTSNSEQPVVESSPAVAATPPQQNPGTLTTEPELPAAAGLRSDNPAAASDNPPASTINAAPPTAPSQPAAMTAAAIDPDAPIVEQLHDLPTGKFDRIIGKAKQQASIDAFYSGRNYAPLWITDGKVNPRAKTAIAYLGRVWADGLDPADYPVPNLTPLTDPVALAEAEIRLTASVITYAHHAQIGRVHWSRVSGDIFYDRSAPDPREVLTTLMEATDVGAALDAYEPHSEGYLALKTKLAELRGGQFDANTTKTPKPNGRQSDRRIDIIMANMERWRWLPHDLGKTYVIVNLPDFTLRVIRQGKQVWMTRIVVGKPATPTPIMSAQMKSITINPTWNVPASIAANEYLPLLQQDPTILQRMGLRMSYNMDGTIHLSQPPGEQNALGQLRFNFPNKFLVYQHDSNQKYLFANERRAESHGCMRVQDPVKYAEVLLLMARTGEVYSQERIRRMFGDNEIDIPFASFIPVHLTYQTAFVDDRGNLQFREDIYGRDQALLAILRAAERKVAAIPIQRHDSPIRRQLLAIPDNAGGGWGGRGYSAGGPNFSTQLFGGWSYQTTREPRQPVVQHRPFYQ